MLASPLVVARGSANCGSVGLMVKGSSGSSLLRDPKENGRRGLRAPREFRVAADADRLRGVRRPQRHAARARRAGRRVDPQRAVPDQRVVEVVEPGPVVGDAHHRLVVGPLGPERQVVGARVVGQRHLDVVAEAEAGPPRQLAGVPCGRERRREIEGTSGRHACGECADVAPLAHVELRGQRDVGFRGGLGVLNRTLGRVVDADWRAADRRVRRARVDAVELRDLVPEAGDRRDTGALVGAGEPLVAIADVVGAEVHGPVIGVLREAEAVDDGAAPLVLIALKTRFVAGHAGPAPAEGHFVPARGEQAAGVFGASRRRGRGGRFLRGRGRQVSARVGRQVSARAQPWSSGRPVQRVRTGLRGACGFGALSA